MEKLEKFIASRDLEDIEILTDTGWVDAEKIHQTIEYNAWSIKTSCHDMICADDHIVFRQDYSEVFVKDLSIGELIWTDSGLEPVKDVHKLDWADNMYDVELPENSQHRYYTNGILSHNTTSYTVFVLWLATFFP